MKGGNKRMRHEDVSGILREAIRVVREAEIPEDLQSVAFSEAVRLISSSESLAGQPAATIPAGEGTPLQHIATRLDLGVEVVSEVYFEDGDGINVGVAPRRLESATARATKQLALLVAAGRQAAGLDAEGWTSTAEIRKVCRDFGKFDEGNFASTIREMQDHFNFRGKGLQRQVRLTRGGWEAAQELVRSLVSNS